MKVERLQMAWWSNSYTLHGYSKAAHAHGLGVAMPASRVAAVAPVAVRVRVRRAYEAFCKCVFFFVACHAAVCDFTWPHRPLFLVLIWVISFPPDKWDFNVDSRAAGRVVVLGQHWRQGVQHQPRRKMGVTFVCNRRAACNNERRQHLGGRRPKKNINKSNCGKSINTMLADGLQVPTPFNWFISLVYIIGLFHWFISWVYSIGLFHCLFHGFIPLV